MRTDADADADGGGGQNPHPTAPGLYRGPKPLPSPKQVRMNDGQYLADAKPGWRRIAIGAAGPVPEAALTMAPSDRLCLTAWRSMFVEGAPATFVNCPKQRSRSSRAAAKALRTAVEAKDAAQAAESRAKQAGASGERAQAAGKRAAQLVISRQEVKVRTFTCRGCSSPQPLASPYCTLSPGEHATAPGGVRRLVALRVGHHPRDRPRDLTSRSGGGRRRRAAWRANRAT